MSKEIYKLSYTERVQLLTKLIRHYDYVYYIEGNNEILDHTYDMFIKELEKLEEKNPQLLKQDSPTQVVGGGFNE